IEARRKSTGVLQSRPGRRPTGGRHPAVRGRGDGSPHPGSVPWWRHARRIWRACAIAGFACLAGPMAASADPGDTPAADTAAEVECLALTVYHEARGEPELGKEAVAHVVVNRSHDPRFPLRLCDVVWQDRGPLGEDCQFTW